MTEENEVIESEISTEAPEVGSTEGAEASPGSSPEPAPIPKGVAKRFKTLAEQRDAYKRELDQLKSSQATTQKQNEKPPEIPPRPSEDLRYDDPDRYNAMMDAREKAIRDAVSFEYQQQQRQKSEDAKKQESAQQQQQRQQEIVTSYVDRGLKAGISEEDMSMNADILKSYDIVGDIAETLYSDELGPQIVHALARDPDLMIELSQMESPIQKGRFIETKLKPRAQAFRNKTTNAPDPVEPTRGSGKRDDSPAGWKFD